MAHERDEPVRMDGSAEVTAEAETVDSLRGQLEEERNRAQAYYANWQRAAADLQNFRRRTEEEKAKNAMFANLALVLNMLPIYDDLERALTNLDTKLAGLQWVEGVRQITRKFQGALEASGVKEILADGEDFNPNLHEAIAHDAGDDHKVVRVVQKGYTMGDRVIRPAMVVVGNGTESGSRG